MLGDWPLPTIRRTVRTNNVAVVRKEESVYSTGEARHDPGSAPVAAQGLLFTDDLPELREDTGYRGPTACRAAGITYRQLDYWARTGLAEPSVRSASDCWTAGSPCSRFASLSAICASMASRTFPGSPS